MVSAVFCVEIPVYAYDGDFSDSYYENYYGDSVSENDIDEDDQFTEDEDTDEELEELEESEESDEKLIDTLAESGEGLIVDDDEDSLDEDDDARDYSGTGSSTGKLGNGVKLSGDVKERIMQYVNSLDGHFTSPYKRGGTAVAWQCCAYVNQVWKRVFGVDLYSIPAANSNKFSYNGESAYEFFERVGLKTGDVIYTRYQKYKKNSKGGYVYDKKGNLVKTMGQHFVIVLDYDEDYVWYTDGYESSTRGFVISAKNKKVKYSESKYFRNLGGAYANIEGAYYALAGKKGTRFRHYSVPENVWKKAGGDKSGKWYVSELSIKGLSDDGYEYSGSRIRPVVNVYDNGELLVEGRDYALRYENNLDAGTATVWVRGNDRHKGTVSGNYVIKPYDLKKHFGSEWGVKDIVVYEKNKEQKEKPLVECQVEDINGDLRTVSSNMLGSDFTNSHRDDGENDANLGRTPFVSLVEGISVEYEYSDESDGAYVVASDNPYEIRIKGIGNFTGEVSVWEYIKKRR